MRHYDNLARELTSLMQAHRLTAAALAQSTGIDLSTVRRMRAGRCSTVSTRNLVALSALFEIPLPVLIDRFSGLVPKEE